MQAYLGAGAGEIRAEHDRPWRLVVELAASVLEAVLEQLDVTTTAVAALLVLDFVLDDERLVAETDGLGEGRGDSMMGRLGLGNETEVALDGRVDRRLLDGPLADVGPGLAAGRSLLGRLRRRPTGGPVVGELLEERRLDRGRLWSSSGATVSGHVSSVGNLGSQ